MTEPLPDLTDLRDLLDEKVLTMPIGGTRYLVRPCSAKTWLLLQEIHSRATGATAAGKAGAEVSTATGVSSLEMFKMALGPTFDEMVEGEVSAPELEHCGLVAYYWQLGQSEVAAAIWNAAGKAPAPTNRAARRSSTRTSTGAATTTRKRASGSGTSSRER